MIRGILRFAQNDVFIMIESSPTIEKLLDQYLHLDIAGKKVRCPYWRNKIDKRIWGPFGGKGKPEQLVQATLDVAKMQKVNLGDLSIRQIENFMKKNRIGIDCSGLAYWLLDVLDKEKGGNGLEDDIPGAKGRFLTRASVEMLTNDEVSKQINKISDVKVGDMIRVQEGKHMAVTIRIRKVKDQIKELVYAHSSNLTKVKGVHTDKILIKNPDGGLENQIWQEKTAKGENYGKKYFWPERRDGVRRLKNME